MWPGFDLEPIPEPQADLDDRPEDPTTCGTCARWVSAESVTDAREERAAILEVEGGMPRVRAEQIAELAAAYYAHHWSCPTCRHGTVTGAAVHRPCTLGADLWRRYSDTCGRGAGRMSGSFRGTCEAGYWNRAAALARASYRSSSQ